jgi:hypothetical protein
MYYVSFVDFGTLETGTNIWSTCFRECCGKRRNVRACKMEWNGEKKGGNENKMRELEIYIEGKK